jgi:IMP dehydrogenase
MGKFKLQETQLGYDDVLISPTFSYISSRFSDEVNPYYVDKKLPIVTAPMDTICSEQFVKLSKDSLYVIFSHRFQTLDEQIEHIKFGANGGVIGLTDTDETIQKLIDAGATHILLDVANGGNVVVTNKLKELQKYRNVIKLWAGNITEDTYINLMYLCDYVRCGIAVGNACSTAISTAIGCGIISTIIACREKYNTAYVEYLHFNKEQPAKIVADGGIKTNGDICKALAAGAHIVMVGRMFAGANESAAPYDDNINFKKYRGMASEQVNVLSGKTKFSIEGASGKIEVIGSVIYIIDQIDSNLRSSMSYVNATDLNYYHSNTQFIKISPAAYNMAKPQI